MVYFEATANGDTLSQKGGLHAARGKKGTVNGPGPQLADAAGGPEVKMPGATSLVADPRRQQEGLMPAALVAHRAGKSDVSSAPRGRTSDDFAYKQVASLRETGRFIPPSGNT